MQSGQAKPQGGNLGFSPSLRGLAQVSWGFTVLLCTAADGFAPCQGRGLWGGGSLFMYLYRNSFLKASIFMSRK